jgi:Rrf2 family protein
MTPDIPLIGLSKSARYAMNALGYLASRREEGFLMTDVISMKTKIPSGYLAKLFQKLTHAGIIESRRGRHGGVRLSIDPRFTMLSKIIELVEPVGNGPRTCLVDVTACSSDAPCPLHDRVVEAERNLLAGLSTITIADFAKAMDLKHSKQN